VDPERAALIARDDLARTIVAMLNAVGAEATRAALGVALWGDAAPLGPLGEALDMPATMLERVLSNAIELGILEHDDRSIRFRHDRLRSAVLAASAARSPPLAAVMADRLINRGDAGDATLLPVALRLRLQGGLEDVDPGLWRDRFTVGAKVARLGMDLDSATLFAEVAWRLRGLSGRMDVQVERALLREAAMAASDRNDAEATSQRLDALFQLPRNDVDLGDDYELAIVALRLVGRPDDAWRTARAGLERLGLKTPDTVRPWHIALPLLRWKLRQTFSGDRGPPALDGPPDAIAKVGNAAGTMAYERSPLMSAFLVLRGYERLRPTSRGLPLWQANDAFLAAMLGDFERAARLGERAAAAVSKPGYNGFARAATLYRALYWGSIWRRPQASLRARCREVRDLALTEGDLIQAAVAIRNWIMIGWRTTGSLDGLARDIRQAQTELARLGDRDVHAFVSSVLSAVRSLSALDGVVDSERAPMPGERPDWARSVSHDNALLVIELASVHRDWRYTREVVRRTPAFKKNISSHPRGADWRFHDGLARLKCGERLLRADVAYLERAVRLNPTDNRVKLLVLRAEQCRIKGRATQCLAAYATAAELAERGDSRLEAGVALEGAAEAARAFSNPQLAADYERRAQAVWRSWGATVKLTEPLGEANREGALVGELADARTQAISAERVAKARSRFLADVAHELRTPLQSMQGLLDLAADDPSSLDLANLRDVFVSLKTVVNDLTDFGALSSGEMAVVLAKVSIVELMKAECAVGAVFAREQGAEVVLEIEPGLPNLIGSDGPRVRQVLRNLLSNAAKYGGPGCIQVTLTREPDSLANGAMLRLVVEDQGPGLDSAALVHVFEPFDRGARAGDGLGLGLGLAVSRRIAGALGGSLHAENRSTGGARFVFRFPLRLPPADPAPSIQDARALNILLAEDVPLVRRVLAAILETHGHEVTEADNGDEALALLSALDFDLAILDLGMPILSGLEVLKALKSRPGHAPAPPVILLTASGDETIETTARAAGAASVLRKPVSAAELLQSVNEMRGLHGGTPVRDTLQREMLALRGQALEELITRIDALLANKDASGSSRAAQAHSMAGLAAQFDWPDVATAADRIEQALRDGAPPPSDALSVLSRARAQLAQSDRKSASIVPS